MKSVKISLEGTIPVLVVYLVEAYRRNLLSVELAEIGFGIDGPVSECVCFFCELATLFINSRHKVTRRRWHYNIFSFQLNYPTNE
jgi:hypothetical protein